MKDSLPIKDKTLIFFLLFVSCIIHSAALFSGIFSGDSSFYAQISAEMLRSNNLLHLTSQGEPYLDKPHLFFWLAAGSCFVFGANGFAFKFPSLLAFFITLFAVYRFGKNYYGEVTGRYAALICSLALGSIFMTNDVRMEAMLTAFIALGLWCTSEYLVKKKSYGWMIAVFCFAAAFYIKGAIGVAFPLVAVLPQFLRDCPLVKTLKLIVFLIVGMFVLLLPLFVIAYHQFGWEGVEFFAWKHFWGRTSGEAFNNNPDPFFVWHTMLWVFAPFTLFLLVGSWRIAGGNIRQFLKPNGPEIISLSGLFLGLALLTFPRFLLSHYVYPLIPLASIVAVRGIEDVNQKIFFSGLQYCINAMLTIVAGLFLFYVTPASVGYVLVYISLFGLWLVSLFSFGTFLNTAISAIVLNFVISFVFFPTLLCYVPETAVLSYIKEHNLSYKKMATLHVGSPPLLNFYTGQIPQEYYDVNALLQGEKSFPFYTITNQKGYDEIKNSRVVSGKEMTIASFHVTKLTIRFLDPATRDGECQNWYVVKVMK